MAQSFQACLSGLSECYAKLEEENGRLQEENRRLREELSELEQSNEDGREENCRLRKELSELKQSTADGRKQNLTTDAKQRSITRLQQENAAKLEMISEYRLAMERLTCENERLSSDLEKMLSAQDLSSALATQSEQRVADAENRVKEITARMAASKHEHAKLNRALEEKNADIKQKFWKCGNELVGLKDQIRKLNDDLKRSEKVAALYDAETQKLIDELKRRQHTIRAQYAHYWVFAKNAMEGLDNLRVLDAAFEGPINSLTSQITGLKDVGPIDSRGRVHDQHVQFLLFLEGDLQIFQSARGSLQRVMAILDTCPFTAADFEKYPKDYELQGESLVFIGTPPPPPAADT